MYRALKWFPAALLTIHIAAKIYLPQQSLLLDLLLYNLIWIFAVLAIAQAPLTNDPIAIAGTCLAITFWGIGSVINSYSNFYIVTENSELVAQICYSLFYPCALFALPRVVARGRKLNPLEILDAAIFGLGISSIATALFISKVFPSSLIDREDQFFALLFPIADLLLLTLSIVAAITHRLHPRALFLFLGFALFSSLIFSFYGWHSQIRINSDNFPMMAGYWELFLSLWLSGLLQLTMVERSLSIPSLLQSLSLLAHHFLPSLRSDQVTFQFLSSPPRLQLCSWHLFA